MFISCFLFYEYREFKKQSGKLVEIQEDYRTYILAVNKILKDYNKVKEKLEALHSGFSGQKKKETITGERNCAVFSSDFDSVNYDYFFVLNRDIDHLRESTLEFIKKQDNCKSILDEVDISELSDYTDHILAKSSLRSKLQKKRKTKKTKKVSSYVDVNHAPRKRSVTSSLGDISLSWPIAKSNFWLSSLYGPRKKRNGAWGFHYGVDMAALKGTEVCAAYTGIVVEARYSRGYGNTIVVAHSRKYRTRYAHLSRILVKVGQKIKRGAIIGKVGDTGYVRSSNGKDASHLHFELIEFGKKINPMPFIS